MPHFRKKPVVISAEQWTGPECLGKVEGVREATQKEIEDNISLLRRTSFDGEKFVQNVLFFVVETLEGLHFVTPGDWIIMGVKGERYPCKPDIFEATYEPARMQCRYCGSETKRDECAAFDGDCAMVPYDGP